MEEEEAEALGCWQLAVWQAALVSSHPAGFTQLLSDGYYHLEITWTEVFVGEMFRRMLNLSLSAPICVFALPSHVLVMLVVQKWTLVEVKSD